MISHELLLAGLALLAATAAPWPIAALGKSLRAAAARRRLAADQDDKARASEIQRLTARCEDLEDLVDLLRRALDKNMIRESAVVSACELLIAMANMVPNPNEAMRHIRDRALQLLIDARSHTRKIGSGGTGK